LVVCILLSLIFTTVRRNPVMGAAPAVTSL
jgi:hypothetical protein